MKLGWRDLGWALLIGAATLVANGTPLNSQAATGAAAWVYNGLQFGPPAVLFIRLADAAVDSGRLRAALAYPAAVLTTVLLCVWGVAPALQPWLGRPPWWSNFNDYWLASTTLVWHALGVAVYVQIRLSQRAQARLLTLQASASSHQRELAGAQLAALQARVEPELLFERLQHIDTELRDDPATARARLVALIELLRAVQPHEQAAASNLAREIDAVRAYAKLISADAQHLQQLQLEVMTPTQEWPSWPDWPLAPWVLLPLMRPLLADGHTRWRLALQAAGAHAELRLSALGPDGSRSRAASERVPLAALNERLRAVHGAAATLTLHAGSAEQLPTFSLRWPLATTPAAAPR
jgi:Histidine kinase